MTAPSASSGNKPGKPLGCALFTGVCSGHGAGTGSSHHPGLGGGMLSPCPHPSLSPNVVPKPVQAMNATTLWPPCGQTPLNVMQTVVNVVVNGQVPIVDQDLLIPHPTPTVHTTSSVGFKCAFTTGTPAWWCTVGIEGGRETAKGHSRKLLATTATVFINGRRAGRMADPLGDQSPAFPCTSLIATASPNVYVGG